MNYPFEYRRLGDFTYHVLTDPAIIKSYLMKWIMREWEIDHHEAPDEGWTVEWMNLLPQMIFKLEIIKLEQIQLNPDLIRAREFLSDLQVRADEREESILRGTSIEPLLINQNGFEVMDGYTRYTVLKRYKQQETYAYIGSI